MSRAAVVAVAALVVAGGAEAYFTSTGSGAGSGSVTTLSAPTISSATPGAGTVDLSWTAVTPPGSGAVTYYVKRDGGAPAAACPSSSSPSSVTSCTDSGLSVGSHSYTVTALWRTWAATSTTTTVQVTFGAATQLALAAASTTPSAGAADNLTITAEDSGGHTVTTYTGSHSLTFGGAGSIGGFNPTVTNSSGTPVVFGSATSLTFTNGVASVTGSSNGVMKLYKAETASITVTDGSITNGSGLAVTVSPLTAASLSLSPASTTPTAGAADNLTITALDTYGNTATTYTGSHALTFSGASSIGSFNPTVTNSSGPAIAFGSATPITFTSGVATVSGPSNGVMTLYKAETASITVTDGLNTNGSGVSVTVSSAAAASLVLAAASTTPTAGATDNLTITALDTYGNTATATNGATSTTFGGASSIGGHTPTVTNSSGGAVAFGTATTITFTSGVATVSGSNNGVMKLYKAETASITVSISGATNGAGLSVTVSPASASGLALSPVTTTPTAGATDNLTITAFDTYGNTATSYTGSHNLTFGGPSSIGSFSPTISNSSGTAVAFGTTTAMNFASGVATVSGSNNGVMKLYKAETAMIGVTDGTLAGGGVSVTVAPASAASLSLSAASTTPTAGSSDNLTITALDAYGNTATSYTGSHDLTFGGANTIGANHPTVTNTGGTAVQFGSATAIGFVSGVASVTASSNGVMKLYKAETASIMAADGSISTAVGLSVTVSAAAATPSGLVYVDKNLTTADQVTGTTSANLSLIATQTQGDHVGNTYSGNATVTGAFTINVEAYNGAQSGSRQFTYSVVATDTYGNQTPAATVTATDTH